MTSYVLSNLIIILIIRFEERQQADCGIGCRENQKKIEFFIKELKGSKNTDLSVQICMQHAGVCPRSMTVRVTNCAVYS